MEEYSILVEDLSKSFGGFTLDHISFKVPKGRIVGFIGENGAGKSTTIHLILNELKKDSGEIKIFGTDHTDCSVKEQIGVVFDECNFHDVFTAKNMEKILSGVYRSWDSSLYRQYLKRFGLPSDQPVGTFSKGMKMKLAIAVAFSHHSKLLILDEETSGLDPVMRDDILNMLLNKYLSALHFEKFQNVPLYNLFRESLISPAMDNLPTQKKHPHILPSTLLNLLAQVS